MADDDTIRISCTACGVVIYRSFRTLEINTMIYNCEDCGHMMYFNGSKLIDLNKNDVADIAANPTDMKAIRRKQLAFQLRYWG